MNKEWEILIVFLLIVIVALLVVVLIRPIINIIFVSSSLKESRLYRCVCFWWHFIEESVQFSKMTYIENRATNKNLCKQQKVYPYPYILISEKFRILSKHNVNDYYVGMITLFIPFSWWICLRKLYMTPSQGRSPLVYLKTWPHLPLTVFPQKRRSKNKSLSFLSSFLGTLPRRGRATCLSLDSTHLTSLPHK